LTREDALDGLAHQLLVEGEHYQDEAKKKNLP